MSRIQSEAIVGALHDSISESQTRVTDLFASKAELLAIKSELGERVFNSQLKFDVSQRHQRELAEKELQNLEMLTIAESDSNSPIMHIERYTHTVTASYIYTPR